ncbi:MAG: outer membrane beta-barrel protein [Cytophagales bacterium]|nr:outer membrane beta-barrel protein [Cytophagales bacterium]
MKNLILILFLTFSFLQFNTENVFAQSDTTQWDQPIHQRVSERKIISKNNDTTIIRTIYERDCDCGWHFDWIELEDFGLYPYLELGINNWINDRSLDGIADVKAWGSWNVALGMAKRIRIGNSGAFSLHVGGDFSWYNFKFSDPAYRVNTSTGKAFFTKEQDPNINSKKSKLTVSYFTLHAMPQFHFEDLKLKVGAGFYGGIKLGSHTKAKFQEDGETVKRRDAGINETNSWRYGIKGQVTFEWITVYTNFDLNSVFKEDKGPDLKPFSFGVRFAPY